MKQKPTPLYHVPPNASPRYKSRKTCCIIIDKGKLGGRPIVHLAVACATHDINGMEIFPSLVSGKAIVDPIGGTVRHRDGRFWAYADELEPYTLFRKGLA